MTVHQYVKNSTKNMTVSPEQLGCSPITMNPKTSMTNSKTANPHPTHPKHVVSANKNAWSVSTRSLSYWCMCMSIWVKCIARLINVKKARAANSVNFVIFIHAAGVITSSVL